MNFIQGDVHIYLPANIGDFATAPEDLTTHGFKLQPGVYAFNIVTSRAFIRTLSRSVVAVIRYRNMHHPEGYLKAVSRRSRHEIQKVISQIAYMKMPFEFPSAVSNTPYLKFFRYFLFPLLSTMISMARSGNDDMDISVQLAALSKLVLCVCKSAAAAADEIDMGLLAFVSSNFRSMSAVRKLLWEGEKVGIDN